MVCSKAHALYRTRSMLSDDGCLLQYKVCFHCRHLFGRIKDEVGVFNVSVVQERD